MPPWEAYHEFGIYQDFYLIHWEHPFSDVDYSRTENGFCASVTEPGLSGEDSLCAPDLDSMQSSRTVCPPPTLHDTCQNKGQNKCKKKVNCQNACQNISHEICQSKCQNTCQNVRHRTFATTNVRQYVRADVRVALRIFA